MRRDAGCQASNLAFAVTRAMDEVPQLWASLEFGVSSQKAPALAQLFGTPRANLIRPGPFRKGEGSRHLGNAVAAIACCKIVTVHTIRNRRVEADVKLSRIVRVRRGVVYNRPGTWQLRADPRQIAAKSQ